MNRGFFLSRLGLALGVLSVIGCTTGPDGGADQAAGSADLESDPFAWAAERIGPQDISARTDDPARPAAALTLDAEAYNDAYRIAIESLRDTGFRIARDDPRFGVITTHPKDAPTIFEPWVGDNSNYTQARDATLNDLRRVVTVRLEALENTQDRTGDRDNLQYELIVEVVVERRQEPTRYLTHSARGRIIAHYSEAPVRLAQRGLDETYWEPIGTDTHMANRLLETIQQRMTRRDSDG